jgi:hypothetical protein
MAVRVSVRFTSVPVGAMRVLMMNIVCMGMEVLERIVAVRMLMSFCQVKPYTNAHHQARERQD